LTYAQLDARANALAAQLCRMGVGADVLVGLCVQRSLDMIVGMLGILKAGGAYLPIDPEYPDDRLGFMLEDANVPILLTQSFVETPPLPRRSAVLYLDTFAWDGPTVADPAVASTPDDLAYVLYTSGSTGRPKGVAIEHRSVVALVAWAREAFSAQELGSVLASTSMCFDLSVFEIFCPLAVGGQVVVAQNLFELPTLASRVEVSLINTVPSAIRELLRSDGIADCVTTVNLAGEPLAAALVDEIYRNSRVAQVYDLYGPSEDTTYSTWTLRRGDAPATIGRPIANTRVYLLDAHRQPVPKGVPGELYVAGSGLARGYLNRPQLTAKSFLPDPFATEPQARMYRTGDLARYLPDGNIEYLGRIDQQVKLRGFRIELGEIEATLVAHASVRESVVVCREDEPGDAKLAAYVVAADNAALSITELRRYLRLKLPDYMIPADYVQLESIPLTPNGKIDRLRLPRPQGERAIDAPFVAPGNETQQQIAQLCCDILKLDRVGLYDNFFDLGGHSLLVTRLLNRVRVDYGVTLSLKSVFVEPTVEALARQVDTARLLNAGGRHASDDEREEFTL
jgi:amino acid adenylation domain-containing protein